MCKQGNISLQAHFAHLKALIQEVDRFQPPTTDLVTLKCYREELYASIYLSGLHHSITSQIWGSLLPSDRVLSLIAIFFAALPVMNGRSSSPLSATPSKTTPPLAMAISTPRARDDGLPSRSDGGRPPHGNYYPPYPYYGKQNNHADKSTKSIYNDGELFPNMNTRVPSEPIFLLIHEFAKTIHSLNG